MGLFSFFFPHPNGWMFYKALLQGHRCSSLISGFNSRARRRRCLKAAKTAGKFRWQKTLKGFAFPHPKWLDVL